MENITIENYYYMNQTSYNLINCQYYSCLYRKKNIYIHGKFVVWLSFFLNKIGI